MDWTQILASVLGGGGLALALATWLRTRPAMRLAHAQSAMTMTEAAVQADKALWERIAALEERAEQQETRLIEERRQCDERIERIEERHTKDVDELKGEVRSLRHDRNNVRQALYSMFVMLKQPDADVPKVIEAIETMLTRGEEVIAVETAGGKRRRR